MKQHCTHLKKDGRPCRGWAIPHTDPPVCGPHSGRGVGAPPGNQNRRIHGFYSQQRLPGELIDLAPYVEDLSLEPEIALTQQIIEDLYDVLSRQDLTMAIQTSLIARALAGQKVFAQLFRTKRQLDSSSPSRTPSPFDELRAMAETLDLPGITAEDLANEDLTDKTDEVLLNAVGRSRVFVHLNVIRWSERQLEPLETVQVANGIFRGVDAVRASLIEYYKWLALPDFQFPAAINRALDELSILWGVDL